MNRILMAGFVTLIMSASLRGQGFANLDFESAQVVFTPGGIAVSNALPGWSVFAGTNELSVIHYDAPNFGPPQLIGSNNAIAGHFSVDLWDDTSIRQTGLVHSNSESLLFDSRSLSPLVTLGGVNLSSILISIATNNVNGISYGVYGADISGFAGQVETLTFSGVNTLDNIQFSTVAIPEPSAISVLCLGGGVLLYVRRKYFR